MRGRARIAWLVLVVGCGDQPLGMPRDGGRDAGGQDAGPTDGGGGDGGGVDGGSDAGGPAARAFDLDGDGANDSDLEVGACGAGLCLLVESDVVATTEVALPAGAVAADAGRATVVGRRLRVIGDHAGSAIHEVSVLHQIGRGGHDSPALSVIDVEGAVVVATASAPPALAAFTTYALASFTDYPRGPDGRRHPFLAAGYGDSDTATWGTLCLFQADSTSAGPCGIGFRSIATVPSGGAFFREVGGYLQDLDGDGWEDIHLLFHTLVYSISPRTAATIGTTVYDVASITEPGSPMWFHSGRNYGTHAAFTGPDGANRTLVVGGAPVGSFTDANCNVSRFVAVLETTAGAPGSRRMRWADYFGFASSIFMRYDPAFASDPASDLARLGDFVDDCIHRFGDSRSVIDGVEVAIFNYFAADAPVDTCLDEQYALYLPPAWTEEKARIWYECYGRNVGSMGQWGMQARRVTDGSSVTGSLGTYVWGRTDRLLPTGEIVYLVERIPDHHRFDLADVAPTPLHVYALVAGLWTERGVFPVPGRPAIDTVPAEGSVGVGSFTGLAELRLADRDADGLAEVTLDDGRHVGLSPTGTFELRP